MDKSMCRICLTRDIQLLLIVNTHLLEMYESLTMNPENESVILNENCNNQRLAIQHPVVLISVGNVLEKNTDKDVSIETVQLFVDVKLEQENEEASESKIEVHIEEIKEEPEEYMQPSDAEGEQRLDVINEESEASTTSESKIEVHIEEIKEEPEEYMQPSDAEGEQRLDVINEESEASTNKGSGEPLKPFTSRPIPGATSLEVAHSDSHLVEISRKRKQHSTKGATNVAESIITYKCREDNYKTSDKFIATMQNNKKLHSQTTNIQTQNYKLFAKCKERESYDNSPVIKQFKCDICEKSFPRKTNLIRHIRIHGDDKPHQCNICTKRFNNKPHLDRHIRAHAGVKPYQCEICKKGFSTNAILKIHHRTHTGEKPFQCNICNMYFSLKCNLDYHIRAHHTDEKPFKCDLCDRCFVRNSELTIHIRRHTGEKPFQCRVCSKRFTESSNLSNHMRIHNSEKQYQCNICRKFCSQKTHLDRHSNTHR